MNRAANNKRSKSLNRLCHLEYAGFAPSQAKKIEEREKEIKKRDALYQEHIAKLEAKVSGILSGRDSLVGNSSNPFLKSANSFQSLSKLEHMTWFNDTQLVEKTFAHGLKAAVRPLGGRRHRNSTVQLDLLAHSQIEIFEAEGVLTRVSLRNPCVTSMMVCRVFFPTVR